MSVALRTTLDAMIKAIVDRAVADMDALVMDGQAKVGALLVADHGGKPGWQPERGPQAEQHAQALNQSPLRVANAPHLSGAFVGSDDGHAFGQFRRAFAYASALLRGDR